ncbi:MAG TPA: glycosyltransferase family 1 protein [Vicinamibacterales bacterium]|nr:glycosyltransferase family 1 protein [Vicinamibacterales bacterium]
MSRLKVAVIADLLEEGWPSMDLVAEMLVERLSAEHRAAVDATLVRPPLRRRALRLSPGRAAFSADRMANRFWDYPRVVRDLAPRFDVFHVVDHSYAHLVHALPAARTLVTCHDLDTFRSVLEPNAERRSLPFRLMTRRILAGLRQAAHIACDTSATRDGLVQRAGIPPERTTVIHNGPHPSCTVFPEPPADAEAARLVGGAGGVDLLHVGSTIARKRIDVLVQVLAAVRRHRPQVRVVHVGGPLTAAQRRLAQDLGVDGAIVSLPFLDRTTLAAVYRRSALLVLPSDREGFGLPVLEAMACGLPVVASDIDALREVGGTAATFCAVGDVEAWTQAILRLLHERDTNREGWRLRAQRGAERAAAFSWSRYAADVLPLYLRLAGRQAPAQTAGAASP